MNMETKKENNENRLHLGPLKENISPFWIHLGFSYFLPSLYHLLFSFSYLFLFLFLSFYNHLGVTRRRLRTSSASATLSTRGTPSSRLSLRKSRSSYFSFKYKIFILIT